MRRDEKKHERRRDRERGNVAVLKFKPFYSVFSFPLVVRKTMRHASYNHKVDFQLLCGCPYQENTDTSALIIKGSV